MSVARPADQRLAVGDRRKDERAVADGLIAGEAQFAAQARCGGNAVCHVPNSSSGSRQPHLDHRGAA